MVGESSIALMAQVANGGVRRINIGADGIVTLPAGTDPAAIVAEGRDLLVSLPDGTRLVIVDGAVFVPTLVIGTVEVPPPTLVALLIGHEPAPAAGPPPSSGGNFAVPVGTLGDAYARGDLLPPTELAFTTPTFEELDTNVRIGAFDRDPTLEIITPLTPAGSLNATANVSEAGLPARGSESAGSNAASTLETTTGTIQYGVGNGATAVSVNGVVLTGVGQAITTPFGTFTITAARDGAYDYSYTLADNTSGDSTRDTLAVTVTDANGGTATGSLTVTITDDVPTAIADVDRVAAPTGPAAAVTTVGVNFADGSFLNGAAANATQVQLNGATLTAVGGTLTAYTGASVLSASDGRTGLDFTREIDAANDQPEAIRVTFATDQRQVGVLLGEFFRESIVSPTPDAERVTVIVGLADGTTATRTVVATETSAPGELLFNLSSADFGGRLIRSVQLTPDLSPPALPDGLSDTDRARYGSLVFSDFVLRGLSYDVANVTPTATFADGNVLTGVGGTDANTTDGVADVRGADGANVTGVVAGIATSAVGNLGTAIAGQFGSLTLSADGSYRYVPSTTNTELRALIPGETRTDTFTYTITDGDGDTSSTTLTITVDGTDDPIAIGGLNPAITGGDVRVSEANLANGTAPNAAALTGTGDFTVAAPDGYGTISVAGRTVYANGAFTAATITTPLGNTLIVNGFNAATGTVSYQYTLNGPNGSGTDGAAIDRVNENFTVTATDRNGSTASGTLVATIFDDAPIANADVDRVTVGTGTTTSQVTTSVDYTNQGLFSGLASGSTQLTVGGVRLDSVNGALSYFQGASVLSPGDNAAQGWTQEVDRYNDQPEGLRLTFTEAQQTVRVTVGQLYQEQLFQPTPDAEKVTVLVTLADGSTATRTITATATTQPGEASITLSAADFGGRLITSVVLTPDAATPTLPAGVTIPAEYQYNATHPYSDFVLRGVEYQTTVTTPATNSFADGNVLTGIGGTDANASDGVADLLGADGGRITAVGANYDTSTGTVGGTTVGLYGTLTLAANGAYTYVLNNDSPVVRGLGDGGTLTDRFAYTITDGDGDKATTTLTITIQPPGTSGAAAAAPAAIAATTGATVLQFAVAGAERTAEATSAAAVTSTLVAAATVAAAATPIAAAATVYQEHAAIGSSGATAAAPTTHAESVSAAPAHESATTTIAAEPQATAHASAPAEAAPVHAEAAGVAGTPAALPDAHPVAANDVADHASLPAIAPMPVEAVALPPAAAVAAVAPAAQASAPVATVLADVLHAGAPAGTASVDQLLSALPVDAQHDAGHALAAVAAPDAAHAMAAAWTALAAAAESASLASTAHDGVTVVAHAA